MVAASVVGIVTALFGSSHYSLMATALSSNCKAQDDSRDVARRRPQTSRL